MAQDWELAVMMRLMKFIESTQPSLHIGLIMIIMKRSALNKYLLIEVPLSEKIAFGRGVHTRWGHWQGK